MNQRPSTRLCFGMTLHNNAEFLPEAIESLIGQTYQDFKIVVVDDHSTDSTEEIIRCYADKDDRISYYRNSEWKGMIATWRRAFFLSSKLHRPEFFAWASDHDRWAPQWAEKLVDAMDANENVVLVHPSVEPIDASGATIEMVLPEPFSTHGLNYGEHLLRVCLNMQGAGYAIYGLFRTKHLRKAGVFRRVLFPDRLLLTELAAHGWIKHLPQMLWSRRFISRNQDIDAIIAAQRGYLFGPGPAPLHSYCPYTSHVLSLLRTLSLDPASGDLSNFFRGLSLAGLIWEKRHLEIEGELTGLRTLLQNPKGTEAQTRCVEAGDRSTAGGFVLPMEIALLLRSLDEEGHRIPGRAGELASLAALAFLMNRYDTQAELQQKLEVAAAEKRDLQKRFDLEKATKKELKQEYQSVLQDFRAQREKEQQLYESRLAEKIADKERFKSKVNDLIRKCEDSQANKAQLKVALEETRRRAELASSQAERVAQKLFQKKADKDRLKLKLNDLNRKFEDSQKALKQIGDRFEALQKEHEVAARRLEADVEKWRTLAQMSIVKRAYRRAKRLLGEHAPR